jgi:hypothetical protein
MPAIKCKYCKYTWRQTYTCSEGGGGTWGSVTLYSTECVSSCSASSWTKISEEDVEGTKVCTYQAVTCVANGCCCPPSTAACPAGTPPAAQTGTPGDCDCQKYCRYRYTQTWTCASGWGAVTLAATYCDNTPCTTSVAWAKISDDATSCVYEWWICGDPCDDEEDCTPPSPPAAQTGSPPGCNCACGCNPGSGKCCFSASSKGTFEFLEYRCFYNNADCVNFVNSDGIRTNAATELVWFGCANWQKTSPTGAVPFDTAASVVNCPPAGGDWTANASNYNVSVTATGDVAGVPQWTYVISDITVGPIRGSSGIDGDCCGFDFIDADGICAPGAFSKSYRRIQFTVTDNNCCKGESACETGTADCESGECNTMP